MSGKAASFLRMLKYATNETIFQQSLVRYLKKNKQVDKNCKADFQLADYYDMIKLCVEFLLNIIKRIRNSSVKFFFSRKPNPL